MSEPPSVESLRRTRSANDIQSPYIQVPPSVRHSRPHRSRLRHTNTTRNVNPDVESWRRSIPPNTSTEPVTRIQVEPRQLRPPQLDPNASWLEKIKFFFGYGENGDRVRKSRFLLTTNLAWCFTQSAVCISMLVVAANTRSPTNHTTTEWHACNRPLGVWGLLWIIKVSLSVTISYWAYVRESTTIRTRQSPDPENLVYTSPNPTPRRQNSLTLNSTQDSNRPSGSRSRSGAEIPQPSLPYTTLYNRLTVLSSLATLTWFLTAHILEYTTVDSCRLAAPHLWWLIFGILCIMYVMVLEVVALGFIVFILAPIVFLFWNILLIIIGRHPYQNPNNAVLKPEIGKLPKSVVNQIPLVVYIPPPPDTPEDSGPVVVPSADDKSGSTITIPPTVHLYPPTNTPGSPRRKRRFKFLRLRRKRDKGDPDSATNSKTLLSSQKNGEGKEKAQEKWEDRWEECEYPFVRIGGNRAVCSICLLDFEEPRRIPGFGETSTSNHTLPATGVEAADIEAAGLAAHGESDVQEIQVENPTEEEEKDRLKLIDAGEGPQPLRLLGCGHAFHKTCVDPWLTDVSGRCPVCQRPIEIAEVSKKK